MIAKAVVCNSLILEVEDCTKVSAARMAFVVSEFICRVGEMWYLRLLFG